MLFSLVCKTVAMKALLLTALAMATEANFFRHSKTLSDLKPPSGQLASAAEKAFAADAVPMQELRSSDVATTDQASRRLVGANTIRVASNVNVCVDSSGQETIYFFGCHGGANQDFYYDAGARTIKDGYLNKCWAADGGRNVVETHCTNVDAKKWTVENDGTIKYDGWLCLSKTDYKLEVQECTLNDNQLFLVPNGFGNRKNLIQSYQQPDKCFDFDPGTSKNIYLGNCHGGRNQNFFYSKDSKRIFVEGSANGETLYCMDYYDGNSVWGHPCHEGLHQKWFADDMGRLHSSSDGRCLQVNEQNNDIIVADCSDKGNQRFVLPDALVEHDVPVKFGFGGDMCWDANHQTGNLYIHACHWGINQNFYYVPEEGHIMDGYGVGCLDAGKADLDVYLQNTCYDGYDAQKFSFDDEGRVRVAAHADLCLEATLKENLKMAPCNDKDSQRFTFYSSSFDPLWENINREIKSLLNSTTCLALDEQSNNVYIDKCSGEFNQAFLYAPESMRVMIGSKPGYCLDDDTSEYGNLNAHPCHTGSHQKFYVDEKGRLHGRHKEYCLEVDETNQNNLRMAPCTAAKNQKFAFGKSFQTPTSQVSLNSDATLCWEVKADQNIHLSKCSGAVTQDFLYVDGLDHGSEHIISIRGDGCLEEDISADSNRKVRLGSTCTTEDRQKWYPDTSGRLLNRHSPGYCLDHDVEKNLVMALCSAEASQKFFYPNSFPVAVASPRATFARRQEINGLYSGTNSSGLFGEKTRTILRYRHPDQVQRNLCPYYDPSFSFDYVLQNYQISTKYVLEVEYTDVLENLLTDSSRPSKTLVIKRPTESNGFYRLGDIAGNDIEGPFKALMVKATDESILQPPVDFMLIWDGSVGTTENTTAATASGSFWRPVAPVGYTCLGDVWQNGKQKPPLDTIRCVLDMFVEATESPTWIWDNNDANSEREVASSVWMAEAAAESLAPATLLVMSSFGSPLPERRKVIKKRCTLSHGAFPFCGTDDNLQLNASETKQFSVPYAKLRPCYFKDEDKEGYGFANEANSTWKDHSLELFEYSDGNSTSVGFKHVGASESLKAPYCLGTSAFGSSQIQSDLFVHDFPSQGHITKDQIKQQIDGQVGSVISKRIEGDFVFLFPCSPSNELRDYMGILQQKAKLANDDGLTVNAVLNRGEDLGQVANLGDPKWTLPHFCGEDEDPTDSGGCSVVEDCYFETNGCKTFDQMPCETDSECHGGYCSKDDGICGKRLILYTQKMRAQSVALPRAQAYGGFQDGEGKFVVKDEGKTIQLSGNVWKAFEITHEVNSQSILEFDFRVVDEAEGLAICLDEDLNEDVEIKEAYRCFRLAGTQDAWSEVWKLPGPSVVDGEWRSRKVNIGSLIHGPVQGKRSSYLPWGLRLKFLAFVQDNDESRQGGRSEFRNVHLYHDGTLNPEVLDTIPPLVSDNSVTIYVENPDRKTSFYEKLLRLNPSDPETKFISVKDGTTSVLQDSSLSYLTHKFDGLAPGKQYSFELFPEGQNVNSGQTGSVVTRCCCDCVSEQREITGDTSGRPVQLEVFQREGFVTFKFSENSQCGEAYAFDRSIVEEEFQGDENKKRKISFSGNYYYFAEKQCTAGNLGDVVEPGEAVTDNLKTAQLVVGNRYRYCVRAVARYYAGESHSSDETCTIHQVRWQASFAGEVTTAPEYGGVPIEDVAVSWELMNPDQTIVIAKGEDITDKAGGFSVVFDESHNSLDTYSKFPVRIKYAKTTIVGNTTIRHSFLCNEGNLDCTNDGVVAYLQHLHFDVPIVSYDNSSIPVRGRVNIWEPDGCPLIGAQVCLKLKHAKFPETLGACVETDFNGDYVVPATIGATVGIEVNFHQHKIPKAPENVLDYSKGIFIDVNKRYERNDFIDMSKALLDIEVVGGLCDLTLGTSALQVKVNGCEQWKLDFTQKFFKGQHQVPAHVLGVRVQSVVDKKGKSLTVLKEYFAPKTMTQTIDLLDAEQDQSKQNEAKENKPDETSSRGEASRSDQDAAGQKEQREEAGERLSKLRFQYDGDLQITKFIVQGDRAPKSCTLDSFNPSGDYGEEIGSDGALTTASFHVLPAGFQFKTEVFFKYKLLEGLFCDILPEDITVRFTNQVGIDSTGFDDYVLAKLTPDKGKQLRKCSDGCDSKVRHSNRNGVKTEAKALATERVGDIDEDIEFRAGRPSRGGDHTKEFLVEVLDEDLRTIKTHRARVAVVGDYALEKLASFALPTYEPILILRDPPGGLSQATYSNMESTIKVESSYMSRTKDLAFGMGFGFGASGEVGLCVGLGAMACDEMLEIEGGLTTGINTESQVQLSEKELAKTAEYSVTWSYSTSDDPNLAGRQSDVFVIPNLNVLYQETESYLFESCKVTVESKVTFDLKEGKKALSFLTVQNIESSQIPKLLKGKESKAVEYEKSKASKGENHAETKELKQQLDLLEEALKGWNQSMENYNTTNHAASTGTLKKVAKDWFKIDKGQSGWEPEIAHQWANLAPLTLAKKAQRLDLNYVDKSANGMDTIQDTNRIQFSGGGGTMEVAMAQSSGAEENRLLNGYSSTMGQSIGGNLEAKVAHVSFSFEAEFSLSYSHSSSKHETNGIGSETAVSFVLGDEQEADDFVFDLYVDERYGTFVFNTVSGRSSCPHEKNTMKGEDLYVSLKRPELPAMPDEVLVFEVTMGNNGLGDSDCILSVDQSTNSGSLEHKLAGDGPAKEYSVPSMGQVKTTLEVRRGPGKYVYEATKLGLAGSWSGSGTEGAEIEIYNYEDGEGVKWIKFEEPCPQIRWAGDLNRDFKVSVIKDVKPVALTIFNPKKSEGSLEALAKAEDERLNNVTVWYREQGSSDWRKALSTVEIPPGPPELLGIDFANPASTDWKADTYGYSMAEWDIGEQLALAEDGAYDIMVESLCDPVSGAPSDFNAYSPEYLTLIVDRVEPEMYGKALPIRDIVVPGEEVVIVFTEPIQCELPFRFDLHVTLSGLEDVFDDRNLKIDCTGRKLGFQFDPMRINYALLMGREMKVLLDHVKDIEGNLIPDPIKFSKTMANVDSASASTTFDFTLHNTACSEPVDSAAIKEKVALELALSDTSRINVLTAVCNGNDAVATVSLGAKGGASQRRLRSSEPWSDEVDQEHNALDAFYVLLNATHEMRDDHSIVARRLLVDTETTAEHFSVSRLLLHPGEKDVARYSLDAKRTHEEEMILAAADGCDKMGLEHRQHVHFVEHMMNDTETQVKEMNSHLTDLEEHIQDMDQRHHDELQAMDQSLELKLEEILHRLSAEGKKEDSLERHGELLLPPSSDGDAGLAKLIAHMEQEQHDLRVWLQISSFLFVVVGSVLAVWMRKV